MAWKQSTYYGWDCSIADDLIKTSPLMPIQCVFMAYGVPIIAS